MLRTEPPAATVAGRRAPPALTWPAPATSVIGLALVVTLASLGAPARWCLVTATVSTLLSWPALSRVVAVYLATVAVCLIVAGRIYPARIPMLPGTYPVDGGRADTCTAIWFATAVLAGTLHPTRHPGGWAATRWAGRALGPSGRTRRPTGPHGVLAVSAATLVIQLHLVRSGSIGLAAQYGGQTSGGGYLGLLGQLGPVLAGSVFGVCGRDHRRRPLAAAAGVLFLLHLVALAVTGFRGTAPALCLALLLAAGVGRVNRAPGADGTAAAHDPRGLWTRRVWIGLLKVAVAVAAAGGLFLLGAAFRNSLAVQHGDTHLPVVSASTLPRVVANRLDYRPYLLRALDVRDDPVVRAAVNLPDQVAVLEPRFLHPDKPIVDYGRRVGGTVYGLPSSLPTSTTITAWGDGVINGGTRGAIGLIGLWVLLLDLLFRRFGSMTVGALAVRVLLVQAAFDIGTPPILAAAVLLRSLTVLVVVLAALRLGSLVLGRRRPG